MEPISYEEFVEILMERAKENEEREYFKLKWEDIPHVEDYINILMDANIPAKTIESCLQIIHDNFDPIFMEASIGKELTDEIYDQIVANVIKDGHVPELWNRARPESLNALYEITHPRREIPYEQGKHAYRKEVI